MGEVALGDMMQNVLPKSFAAIANLPGILCALGVRVRGLGDLRC